MIKLVLYAISGYVLLIASIRLLLRAFPKNLIFDNSSVSKLMNGEIVQGEVCSKFQEHHQFIVKFSDGFTCDVFDGKAQYDIGDPVIVQRIHNAQVFK